MSHYKGGGGKKTPGQAHTILSSLNRKQILFNTLFKSKRSVKFSWRKTPKVGYLKGFSEGIAKQDIWVLILFNPETRTNLCSYEKLMFTQDPL